MDVAEVSIPRGGRSLRAVVRYPLDEGGAASGSVVFEAGLGLDSTLWANVLELAHEEEALDGWALVASDRAGLGGSDPVPDPRTLSQVMADVDSVIETCGPGPVVLVGHSWGGTLTRLWCAAHPGTAAGLVLVDSSFEGGYEHHGVSIVGRLARGADVVGTEVLEWMSMAGLDPIRVGGARARTQEMRLFSESLDLLESLGERGAAWVPPQTLLVTTAKSGGAQVEIQRAFARAGGHTVISASTRSHVIPAKDPGAVCAALVKAVGGPLPPNLD